MVRPLVVVLQVAASKLVIVSPPAEVVKLDAAAAVIATPPELPVLIEIGPLPVDSPTSTVPLLATFKASTPLLCTRKTPLAPPTPRLTFTSFVLVGVNVVA